MMIIIIILTGLSLFLFLFFDERRKARVRGHQLKRQKDLEELLEKLKKKENNSGSQQ